VSRARVLILTLPVSATGYSVLRLWEGSKFRPNLSPWTCDVESTVFNCQNLLGKRAADSKHGFESRWGHHRLSVMDSKVPPIPRHADVEADPGVLARFNSAVIEEFRANAGVVGGPFENSAVMLLTTTGAKSGQQRMTPVEYFRVDDRVIFVGTRGGAETNPAWVHNLRTNPNVHAEIGAESYDAVARELSGDERESVYSKVTELCPRILTYPVPARQIPVFELKRK
jgi:deazaflavin-dependent oxidoreductase (nitroreductase family)